MTLTHYIQSATGHHVAYGAAQLSALHAVPVYGHECAPTRIDVLPIGRSISAIGPTLDQCVESPGVLLLKTLTPGAKQNNPCPKVPDDPSTVYKSPSTSGQLT